MLCSGGSRSVGKPVFPMLYHGHSPVHASLLIRYLLSYYSPYLDNARLFRLLKLKTTLKGDRSHAIGNQVIRYPHVITVKWVLQSIPKNETKQKTAGNGVSLVEVVSLKRTMFKTLSNEH